MACPRCDVETSERRWCTACERAYDTWSRRHASDILGPVLVGMVIVTSVALVVPLLGVEAIMAGTGVFAGFGALAGLHHLNQRRRRRQFLRGAAMPLAYLPDKT
jgi:hypothetical protein